MKEGCFKISPTAYLQKVLKAFMADWWPLLALPVLVCASLAVVSVNFLIVALMLVFVAAPMAMALLYIYYVLSLEASWSVADKSVVQRPNGDLLLTFADERRQPRLIACGEVAGVSADAHSLLLRLKVRRYTYLVIPLTQFDGEAEAAQFAKVYANNDKNLKNNE